CLLCPSFHGATLFSRLLSNCDGMLALGDTLPPRIKGFVCGCGKHLEECDFWRAVEMRLSYKGRQTLVPDLPTRVDTSGTDQPTWRQYPRQQSRQLKYIVESAEQFFLLMLSMLTVRCGRTIEFRRFSTSYCEFLGVCASHYDFRVFVDGFKSKTRYVVLKACGLPIRGVIHLIRDPRAYVASSKRAGVPVASAAREWVRYHTRIERLTNFTSEQVIRIRYEDLCERPHDLIESVQCWMGFRPQPPRLEPRKDLHWLGNSSLFDFGGHVRRIERWREELSRADLEIICRLTLKTANRYGYAL